MNPIGLQAVFTLNGAAGQGMNAFLNVPDRARNLLTMLKA